MRKSYISWDWDDTQVYVLILILHLLTLHFWVGYFNMVLECFHIPTPLSFFQFWSGHWTISTLFLFQLHLEIREGVKKPLIGWVRDLICSFVFHLGLNALTKLSNMIYQKKTKLSNMKRQLCLCLRLVSYFVNNRSQA